jgi:hypothetical protein
MDRALRISTRSHFCCFLFFSLVLAIPAHAQTPIYSLPFFILFPAKYRLEKSLSYDGKDGSAIMVLCSNVDLDLNGYALEATAAQNESVAVFIDHQQNITIRNGTIRGFRQAILFDDHGKKIAWPASNLADHSVTIQSVNASPGASPGGKKESPAPKMTQQPESTPKATVSPDVPGSFLDRYDATKSSPQPSSSPKRYRPSRQGESLERR